jgi:hypothetical protein
VCAFTQAFGLLALFFGFLLCIGYKRPAKRLARLTSWLATPAVGSLRALVLVVTLVKPILSMTFYPVVVSHHANTVYIHTYTIRALTKFLVSSYC